MPSASKDSRADTARDAFASRHIGPSPDEIREMLDTLDLASLDDLVDRAVPAAGGLLNGSTTALA